MALFLDTANDVDATNDGAGRRIDEQLHPCARLRGQVEFTAAIYEFRILHRKADFLDILLQGIERQPLVLWRVGAGLPQAAGLGERGHSEDGGGADKNGALAHGGSPVRPRNAADTRRRVRQRL